MTTVAVILMVWLGWRAVVIAVVYEAATRLLVIVWCAVVVLVFCLDNLELLIRCPKLLLMLILLLVLVEKLVV